MGNFIMGVIFGIVISTVGFQGLAQMADRAVGGVKQVAQEQLR